MTMLNLIDLVQLLNRFNPEITSKVSKAFKDYNVKFEKIESDSQWASATAEGKALWGNVSPTNFYLDCSRSKYCYQQGRMPSSKKFWACEDGSMAIFVVKACTKAEDPENESNYTNVYDSLIIDLDRLFQILSSELKALPELSLMAESVGITAAAAIDHKPENYETAYIESCTKVENQFKYSVEQAYAGNIVLVPEIFEKLKDFIALVDSTALSIVANPDLYEYPDGYNAQSYIEILKCIAIYAIAQHEGIDNE